MRKPTFSIIIPTLNEEKFLPKLLDSLSRQTDRNFEVIVVDGSSRDKTVAAARTFVRRVPGLTIEVIKRPSLPKQRNAGARLARGEWLVFVDADSILLPYFIERISSYIREQSPQLFTTWFRPDSNNPREAVYSLVANIYIEATLLLKKPLTPGPLTIVHREAFERVGGYDEEHLYNEDADFGLRLHKSGITLEIAREVMYVWSLRRIRKEGTLKVLNQYVVSALPILLFNRSLKRMPGYIMGGHLYGKRRVRRSVLKVYERKLRALMKELFA